MARTMVVLVEHKALRHVLSLKLPLPKRFDWQGRTWVKTGPYRYEPVRQA